METADPSRAVTAEQDFPRWLRARQAVMQARSLLSGLTGCTVERAGAAILAVAGERRVPAERLAADFLRAVGTSRPGAAKLVARLERAARDPQPPVAGTRAPGVPGSVSVPIDAGDLAGVAVTGELDLATAPLLAAAVEHARGEPAGVFLLELVELTFLDVAGLRALERARADVTARGHRLRVAAPIARQPRRLLRLAVDLGWLDAVFAPPAPVFAPPEPFPPQRDLG